jgi:hypothetical protein
MVNMAFIGTQLTLLTNGTGPVSINPGSVLALNNGDSVVLQSVNYNYNYNYGMDYTYNGTTTAPIVNLAYTNNLTTATTSYSWMEPTTTQFVRVTPVYNIRVATDMGWIEATGVGAANITTGNAIWQPADASSWVYGPPKTVAERLREILDSRMAPKVISTCKPLGYTQDVREMRARETLRRVLGEIRFRDFVRRGSVSVRAKSGLTYQIFPGHDFTNVYNSGKMIERLCVVLQGGFPPTDSLIMRYLMLLNNESQFRSYAVKHGLPMVNVSKQPDGRSLVDIYKEIKRLAA